MSDHCLECLNDQFRSRDYACFDYSGIKCSQQPPGCALGCQICDDASGTKAPPHGVRLKGRRWARPAENANGPIRMTRDAWGMIRPLRSNHTILTMRTTTFELAPVYDYFGGECFDKDICDSSFTRRTLKKGAGWCLRTPQLFPLTFPDCETFHGAGVVSNEPKMHCRKCNDALPTMFEPTQGVGRGTFEMMNHANVRTNVCQANAAVECFGAVHRGLRCCEAKGRYYIGPGGQQNLWELMDVKYNSPRFKIDDRFLITDANRARMNVMNSAMSVITDIPKELGTIGRLFHDLPRFSSNNDELDKWVGSYSAILEHGNEPPHKIATWNNCRLRYSGCSVIVDFVIESVDVVLSLQLHEIIDERNGKRDGISVFPSVRSDITVRCAAIARFADGGCDSYKYDGERIDLEIIPTRGLSVNAIAGGVDEIVYVDDDGIEFLPPYHFRWRGGRSVTTKRQWSNIDPDSFIGPCGKFDAPVDKCCRIAAAFSLFDGCNGYKVRGMPTEFHRVNPDGGPQFGIDVDELPHGQTTLIYGGGMSFRIPEFKFKDHCHENCAEFVNNQC